ncbi:hypothetical protein Tco_0857923 [Tanacetum coccineum]|uniref:Uncharacterized protein n=1 Tax=Tanacetum coccineum TaxID=301880 RepID=A0ABQ5B7K2_9ASTR
MTSASLLLHTGKDQIRWRRSRAVAQRNETVAMKTRCGGVDYRSHRPQQPKRPIREGLSLGIGSVAHNFCTIDKCGAHLHFELETLSLICILISGVHVVKMRTTCTWTERPYEASLFPGIGFGLFLRILGGRRRRPPSGGASQKVTEACKGFLGPDEDWPSSAKAERSLTARPTYRAGTKVDLSDSTVPSSRVVAQRIKVTLGITG